MKGWEDRKEGEDKTREGREKYAAKGMFIYITD